MQYTSGHLGALVIATRVEAAHPGPWRTRAILLCLAASCALMMIGFGICTPIFARRLSELGSGMQALSLMTMAPALAQLLLAPGTGRGADRFDRIVLANVLHLEPPEQAAALVGRVTTALIRGGDLVIVEMLGDSTPAGERVRAIYGLHLALRTRQGKVHPLSDLRAWSQRMLLSLEHHAVWGRW